MADVADVADVLIISARRGIGEDVVLHLMAKSETAFSVSRTFGKYS
jgi:hypothetical protein